MYSIYISHSSYFLDLHRHLLRTGGAISATIQSTSFVTDCKLTGNRASKGAAIYVDDASKLVVKNSFFKDNVATQIGGADIFAILALITIEAEYDGTETNWRHSPCFVSNLTATLMNLLTGAIDRFSR